MTDTEAPPQQPAVVPVPPAAPPMPAEPPAAVEQPVEVPEPKQRSSEPKRRGMPIEPLVIAAGNGTTIAATAAYQAAGTAGLIGAAGLAGAGAIAAVVRRRGTVKARRSATAAGRTRTTTAPNRGRGGRGGALGSSGRGRSSGAGAGASPRGRLGRGGALRSATGRGGAGIGAGRTGAPTRLRSAPGGAGGRGNRPGRNNPGAPSNRSPRHARGGGRTGNRMPRVRSALGAAGRGVATTGRGLGAAGRGIGRAGKALARGVGATGRVLGRGFTRAAGAATRLARSLARRTEGARATAGRHIARTGKALLDGAWAGAAGCLSALWNWSPRAGLATLRAMWSKRRRRRRERAVDRGPVMTGPAAAAAPGPIATFVRRPGTAGGTSSSTGAGLMSGHHFLGPAMEMHRIAATYQPDGMMQVGRDFGGLAEALEHVADAMKVTTARADAEDPLDPRIIEMMQQIYGLQIKAAELAQQLKPAFLACHRVDIERLQNPRQGEAAWDVTRNADASL